ncbi:hypothetical protein [Thiothrix nivea]|uniref:Adenylate cyclase n=1 Tax=Thiothrix nivea (strain ATCC 35100 / DSM 5205 / JP2) TaxID=870187 RepID=A0A656HCT4_THINJ|nr:hypothetical protein [Thiothrix nivea]EIJ34951.1 hypothetical protein Thini_2397 [Thiothrix nivea DSM 5205]
MEEHNLIKQELQHVLNSRLLENKKQAINFIAYIMEETLAGRGKKITQYGIAIEALGKPTDYNPTDNPAVRVEAGRVRRLLEEYYATEGRHSKLRITLPVGSYQPVVEWVTPTSSSLSAHHFEPKSIQSLGPKVYISCQNPTTIMDDTLRGLIYNLRSTLPITLGHFREVRIALAPASHALAHQQDELAYAWQHQQAEFLLECKVEAERNGISVNFTLHHTVTHEQVWSDNVKLPRQPTQQMLDAVLSQLVLEAFSLHRGVALAYWSRYWQAQDRMPDHYRVLVEHVHFIQGTVDHASLQHFQQACQTRTQCYHDDSLAHLHYAVMCLYAYMFGFDLGIPLEALWHKLALKAIELNPGNSLAHSIFALECYHRGEHEMGLVEIETARHINPHDCAGGHLLAVGLCALGHWEQAFTLLRGISNLNSSYPDPLRTIPCLYFFLRGEYVRIAKMPGGCGKLGGWETFGKMATHCRMDDCQGCIQTLSRTLALVSPLDGPSPGNNFQPARDLWANIQQRMSQLSTPSSCEDTVNNLVNGKSRRPAPTS